MRTMCARRVAEPVPATAERLADRARLSSRTPRRCTRYARGNARRRRPTSRFRCRDFQSPGGWRPASVPHRARSVRRPPAGAGMAPGGVPGRPDPAGAGEPAAGKAVSPVSPRYARRTGLQPLELRIGYARGKTRRRRPTSRFRSRDFSRPAGSCPVAPIQSERVNPPLGKRERPVSTRYARPTRLQPLGLQPHRMRTTGPRRPASHFRRAMRIPKLRRGSSSTSTTRRCPIRKLRAARWTACACWT